MKSLGLLSVKNVQVQVSCMKLSEGGAVQEAKRCSSFSFC